MEDIELDLLNSGFTNQTLQKMMDLQHNLLKLENATFMQGQDSKRNLKLIQRNLIKIIRVKFKQRNNILILPKF